MKNGDIEVRIEKPFPNIRFGARIHSESVFGNKSFDKNSTEHSKKDQIYDNYLNLNEENQLVNIVFRITANKDFATYLYNVGKTAIFYPNKSFKVKENVQFWMGISLPDLVSMLKTLDIRYDNYKKLFIDELDLVTSFSVGYKTVFSDAFNKLK